MRFNSAKAALAAVAAAALIPMTSHASMIRYGQELYDTQSGLTWLELSATAGLSINQVLRGAGGWTTRNPPGSDAPYYRYATSDEIARLLNDLGLTASPVPTSDIHGALAFINSVGGSSGPMGEYGGTYFYDGNQGSLGMSFDAYVSVSITNGENTNPLSPLCDSFRECATVNIDLYTPRASLLDYAAPTTGSFLVRVPEPESLALFGIGALACLGARRKSKTRMDD